MNQQLIDRIRQCPTLPSLPAVAVQVLDLTQKQGVDMAEIARIISRDPALSSRILRTVNSSFYGRSKAISTISHALVILGLQSVKTLVLGFSLVSNLNKGAGKGGFRHLAYWKRSIYAATAARTIAHKVGVQQQEEAFLGALLMDIGMLVLDQVLGEQYGEVCEKAVSHEDLPGLEEAALGLSHAAAAAVLMAAWKLPPLLTVPIATHHGPEKVEDPAPRRLARVIHLAGRCADVFVDVEAAAAIADVKKLCAERYQMNGADTDVLMDDIGRRTKEVAGLFEINIGSALDYEAILKKANEALVNITLQTQQQASALQQHASVLQHQASSLAQQNHKLKIQAMTDGLTGLANRARFDAFLADQFKSATDEAKPLSLLLLDVDKFKAVNDQHGHPIGDRVLKYLGKLLATAARAQDLAARYGGEELVLILPNTPRSVAAATAESIRRAIASRPVRIGEPTLPTLAITTSIGVASYEPGSPFREPAHLLKAADLAVYAAKRSGRNCVRVFSASKPAAAGPTPPKGEAA